MNRQQQEDDKFLYYLMRLVILWIVIIAAISYDSKSKIMSWLDNYITERTQNEQTIEHDTGRSPQHNI